jgi:hypothetical protein
VGDTTAGTFRFTCSIGNAPCTISVRASAIGDVANAGTVKVYPRLNVYTQGDGTGGGTLAENYCEYADGINNNNGVAAISRTATPVYTAMTLGIGGTADCGLPLPAVPVTGLVVDSITVPAGYYDVHSTFLFLA